ncbi:MAG TPA: lysozyme [Terriglobia bacterium]|nr:lysozyme [Terriglobia bacterium]
MGAFCSNIESQGAEGPLERLQAALSELDGKVWIVEIEEEWPPYHLSTKGLDFISRHETYGGKPALKTYLDSAGRPTIGYGHLVRPDEGFTSGVSMAQALDLLKEDVQKAVDEVNEALNVPLAQNQFDALVDLAYNAGPRSVQPGLEMMSSVNDYDVSESDFTQYDKITVRGRTFVSKGLLSRRIQEWLLFEEGEY